MFLYKDGRFHIEGLSFSIPENFYFKSNSEYERGLEFWSFDNKYCIEYLIFVSSESTEEELYEDEKEYESFTEILPLQPLSHNGLSGHHTAYKTARTQYYAASFLLGETEEGFVKFDFVVSSMQSDITEILKSSEFQTIFGDFRKETA